MTLVRVTCKFTGPSAHGAKPVACLDKNRDGHMRGDEDVPLVQFAPGEWSGQSQTPSHTVNMLILVAYEMDIGTTLVAEAVDVLSGAPLWKRELKTVTSRVGYVSGHLGGSL